MSCCQSCADHEKTEQAAKTGMMPDCTDIYSSCASSPFPISSIELGNNWFVPAHDDPQAGAFVRGSHPIPTRLMAIKTPLDSPLTAVIDQSTGTAIISHDAVSAPAATVDLSQLGIYAIGALALYLLLKK